MANCPIVSMYEKNRAMIESMEPQRVYISEAELARDIRAVLQRVETGAEVVLSNATSSRLLFFVPLLLSTAPFLNALL